jgi:hypothetical protein
MTPSDSASLRDLLSRVASGDLDPSDAARLLDEDASAPTVDQHDLAATRATPAASSSVGSIRVLAGGVKLVIVADPTVATAVAEGPHSVRHDGSTLVIEAPSGEGYQVQDKPKYLGWVPTVWTGGRGERITVRVNPDLPLAVEATASSVEVTGLHADLTVKTQASAVKVREHRGTIHGTATMSSLSVVGVVTGASSLVCEFGSLDLRLKAGSDVVVQAVSEMGSLKLGDSKASQEDNGLRMRGSTGHGAHIFDVTVRMGSASVVAA